jgi:integrase
MARSRRVVLTDVLLRRLRPPATGRLTIADSLVPGLVARITSTGHRSLSFVTRSPTGGFLRLTWPAALGVAAARTRAREALEALSRGIDPRVPAPAPTRVEPTLTVRVAVDGWLAAHAGDRTLREARRRFEKYVLPHWADRSLDSLTRQDVARLYDDVVREHGAVQAARVVTGIKSLLARAVDRGDVPANVAARFRVAPEKSRARTLTDAELRLVWPVFVRLGYPFGDALRLIAWTACRRREIGELTWSEVGLDRQLLALPPDRTKTGHGHEVPLSPPAVALLESCPRLLHCRWAFSATGHGPIHGWSGILARVRADSGTAAWAAHDLRRTCATTLARLGTAPHIIEAILGHLPPRIVRTYVRYDLAAEQRAALERWAEHLAGVVGG